MWVTVDKKTNKVIKWSDVDGNGKVVFIVAWSTKRNLEQWLRSYGNRPSEFNILKIFDLKRTMFHKIPKSESP